MSGMLRPCAASSRTLAGLSLRGQVSEVEFDAIFGRIQAEAILVEPSLIREMI